MLKYLDMFGYIFRIPQISFRPLIPIISCLVISKLQVKFYWMLGGQLNSLHAVYLGGAFVCGVPVHGFWELSQPAAKARAEPVF